MHKDTRARGRTSAGRGDPSGDTTVGWFDHSVLTVLGWIGSVPESAVGEALMLLCDLQAAVDARGERHHVAA